MLFIPVTVQEYMLRFDSRDLIITSQSFCLSIEQDMDWIEYPPPSYLDEKNFLAKLDKFTLYDHNYVAKIDLSTLNFSCVFNCKRLNRQYAILTKIEGDLTSKTIQLICSLSTFTRMVTAKWQHQKIQLTKFANSYNQKPFFGRSSDHTNNYQFKVNPQSGEFFLAYSFFLGHELMKDHEKFKMKMTDQAQKLGEESQKVFNTIFEIIFDEEANDPFLKTDERMGAYFSRPIKLNKLLKKLKKMNEIAPIYKIRGQQSGVNKLRSMFKRKSIKKLEKPIKNSIVVENAMAYVPKFSKKHYDALQDDTNPAKKENQFIAPFEDLEDAQESQIGIFLSKKLQDGQGLRKLSDIPLQQIQKVCESPGPHLLKNTLPVYAQYVKTAAEKDHEERILMKLDKKHPFIIQYFNLETEEAQCKAALRKIRIVQNFPLIPLMDYLQKFANTISLQTRLFIMIQICQVIEILHQSNIGFFLNIHDIYIDQNNIIKVKNLINSYHIYNWDQSVNIGRFSNNNFIPLYNPHDFLEVCGHKAESYMKEGKDEGIQPFQSEKADIYCLGMVLYRVLLNKFPFSPNCCHLFYQNSNDVQKILAQIWTMETQFLLRQGGTIGKLLAQLLLKCFNMEVQKRPFVEWMVVIMAQVKASLSGLY